MRHGFAKYFIALYANRINNQMFKEADPKKTRSNLSIGWTESRGYGNDMPLALTETTVRKPSVL